MSPATGKRRALGQHFLSDQKVVDAILERFGEQLEKYPCPRIIEIGPGQGALTLPLLERLADQASDLLLIEKDRALAARWAAHPTLAGARPLQAIEGDFLDVDPARWISEEPIAVLSNLPYSASTAIIGALTRTQLLTHGRIPFMVLMFQAEVAERLRAPVGTRESSALTVFARNAWEIETVLKVPPSAFSPPPEVNSEVLLFTRREPAVPGTEDPARLGVWERLVRSCFLHRRKMLRSSLKSDSRLHFALEASGVDGTRRPEALKWEDWRALMSKLLTLLALLSLPTTARSNIGDAFGFGSRSSALVGATAAGGGDGFSAYSNPAQLGLHDGRRFVLGWETLWMTPQFDSIPSVVTENTVTSDRVSSNGVDTGYQDTVGQAVGAFFRLAPDFYNLTFGFVSYLPMGRAMYLDSGEPFLPEYVLYRSRTQRPQLDAAVGFSLSPWFSAGIGGHIAFSVTNQADVFLQNSTGKASSMRVRSSLKPKIGPYLGILFAPPADTAGESPWSLGGVLRLPVSSPAYFELTSGAQAVFGVAAVDLNLSAVSILQYDPLSAEMGASFSHGSMRTYLQVEYQGWGSFSPPAMDVSACKNKPCSLQLVGSSNPKHDLRNILIPKIAEEFRVNDTTTLRAGYAYRPSIFRGTSQGAGNYLDPSKHVFGVGAGFKFRTIFGKEMASRLDMHASYHLLLSQKVTKASSTEIGAPGYTAGGKSYGGGISLSVEL